MNRFLSKIIGLVSGFLLALCAYQLQAKPLSLEDVMTAPELNDAIPRPEKVLSVGVGERHLYHHEIVTYLNTLASVSNRMQALPVDHYTYGGRALVSYVISSPINQQLTGQIGAYHARMFDSYGTPYFTEERYDDFFMGKGSTYPDLFGSVGILFEQPSSRGAKQDTVNGLLTFPDTITNQFRTSLSSIEATVALKDELQKYQRHFCK